MDKKTIIAIALSIAILLAWDQFVLKPRRAKVIKPQTTKEMPITQKQQSEKPQAILPQVPASIGQPSVTEEFITAQTPLYEAKFSTKGARLVSFKLKNYHDYAQKPNPSITELIKRVFDSDAPAVKTTNLVQVLKAPMPGVFFTGGTGDEYLIFMPDKSGNIEVRTSLANISFDSQIAEGVILRKTFTFNPDEYLIGYKNTLVNSTGKAIAVGLNVTNTENYPLKGSGSTMVAFNGPAFLNGKHLEEFKLSKIEETGQFRPFSGNVKWFGYEDTYFINAIVAKDAPEANLNISRKDDSTVTSIYSRQIVLETGKSYDQELGIYLGPKEYKTLKKYSSYGLDKALNFGFFDIIAKPLLICMNYINRYIGSYGWSIIILTFIIKIILYPLTLKSFKSMKGLQKIQPLMKEIQQQYKDDRQRQNQELMKLYKENKINPMGGCLPIVLQIPILFALYKVFLSAIELRQTPFHIFGSWLPDLSAPDPYLITPLLMGASWFVQQKMTPTPGDAMQQKIMMMMPLIFTFMFLTFPSGLVIYWLVSNILSIIQQAYINRFHV
jgi:YidC/Oxa1 family membrane protein insertase